MINSSFTLTPVSVEGAYPLEEAMHLLKLSLEEHKRVQQAIIAANTETVLTAGVSKYSGASSRNLTIPVQYDSRRSQVSRLKEMDRSEAYRILLVFNERRRLCEVFEKLGWSTGYSEVKAELGVKWLDWEIYKNVKRSRVVPAVPTIQTVRLPTNKVNDQFTGIEYEGSRLTLTRFELYGKRINIHFQIPEKLLRSHQNYTKIAKPVIRLKGGEVLFDFAFIEPEPLPLTQKPSTVLGVDLGKTAPFTAVRYDSETGDYSRAKTVSGKTSKLSLKLSKVAIELDRVRSKNARREALGVSRPNAIKEQERLQSKRENLTHETDWSTVTDLTNLALPGETIAIEKLNFNTGDSQFRSGSITQKLEHAAAKAAIKVVKVNPHNTSQECSLCSARITHAAGRTVHCGVCETATDRDANAALAVAKRGARQPKKKLTHKKQSPTPKRAPIQRNKHRDRAAHTGDSVANGNGASHSLVSDLRSVKAAQNPSLSNPSTQPANAVNNVETVRE